MLSPFEFIENKQNQKTHQPSEIQDFISGFMKDQILDYQMTAWMMAVFFRGLSFEETVSLTKSMIQSGKRIPQGSFSGIACDKHSTGGVGDKITLILAPLLASAGMVVPTIAGRGLGFTGGTLDKLESIPGFNTQLKLEQITKIASEHN
ncbi:hypothetical protein ACFLQJ_01715 [Calditrichota bacterium]